MTIQAGNYKCRAISATFINSGGEKKTPGVTVTLKLIESDELIDATLWLSDGAKKRSAESLAILGFDGQDLMTITRNEAWCVIEPEEYNGKTYMRVKWINREPGGTKFAPMDSAQQQSIMSELRGLVLAHQDGAKKAEENFGGKKPLF